MSVYKRGRFYHYRFMLGGKDYHGSTKCTTEREARAFEKGQIEEVRGILKEEMPREAVKKLYDKARSAVGGPERVSLADAWSVFVEQPSRRSRSTARAKATQSRWEDFVAFMADRYPEVVNLCEVTPKAAREYIGYQQKHGRWNRTCTFRREGKDGKAKTIEYDVPLQRLSNATKNDFLRTCRMIFRALMPADPAIALNPFGDIDLLTEDSEERGAFEVEEIVRLYGIAAEHRDREIVLPLIVMGAGLALREGDIATLRWEHVDLTAGFISKPTEKTGKAVSIPLWDPKIAAFLRDARTASAGALDTDFCFPELAEMYSSNRTGVGYRFRRFLEDAGYKGKTSSTVKDRNGEPVRDRAVSVLDVHSLRHSFASIAGAAGVPLKTVQLVLGHMNERVTERYWRHARDQELRDKLAAMPRLFGVPAQALPPRNSGQDDEAALRAEAHRLADAADVVTLRKMIEVARRAEAA